MQVHGVSHHGFVDKLEADPLTIFQADRIGIFVLNAIDTPGVPLHIAGQTKLYFSSRFAVFIQWILGLEVSVGQELAAIGCRGDEATSLRIEGVAWTFFSHRHGTMVHAGRARMIHSFHI